jgi:hypothetical protein
MPEILGLPSQVYLIAYVLGSVVSLVGLFMKLFFDPDRQKIHEAVELGRSNTEMLHELSKAYAGLMIRIDHLEDREPQLSENDVKDISRREIQDFFRIMKGIPSAD